MPPKKRKLKKVVRKTVKRKAKKLSPFDTIMAKFRELVPVMKDAKGDLLESWTLFAHKLLLARRLKTSVNVITVNPQMLEYRELIQKAFPCTIQDPTEARFGMDSIEKF